jgi:hypothetical protein
MRGHIDAVFFVIPSRGRDLTVAQMTSQHSRQRIAMEYDLRSAASPPSFGNPRDLPQCYTFADGDRVSPSTSPMSFA